MDTRQAQRAAAAVASVNQNRCADDVEDPPTYAKCRSCPSRATCDTFLALEQIHKNIHNASIPLTPPKAVKSVKLQYSSASSLTNASRSSDYDPFCAPTVDTSPIPVSLPQTPEREKLTAKFTLPPSLGLRAFSNIKKDRDMRLVVTPNNPHQRVLRLDRALPTAI